MTHALIRFLPALALVALASCGARNQAANQIQGERNVENATLTKLQLTSDAFQNGQPIPVQYTCDGADQAPLLHWGDPPQGTKSFALVIDDPDAPSGTFRHWGVYDIPASARSIGGGERIGTEVSNDFGKPGYGGPCPPRATDPTIITSGCSRWTPTGSMSVQAPTSSTSKMLRRSMRSRKANWSEPTNGRRNGAVAKEKRHGTIGSRTHPDRRGVAANGERINDRRPCRNPGHAILPAGGSSDGQPHRDDTVQDPGRVGQPRRECGRGMGSKRRQGDRLAASVDPQSGCSLHRPYE